MSTQTEPKLVTQIDFARAGQITPQMKEVAEREHRDPEYIRERVADGRIAIPANIVHIKKGMRAFGVGEGLSTKVNVNLGISGDKADAAEEWKKVKIAEDFGADAIMDLSNSGKTRQFRQQLIDETPLMVGTVPMYDAIGYKGKAAGQAHQGRSARGRARSCRGRRGLYDHPLRHQQVGHQNL